MALLGDEDLKYLRESFAELRTDVSITVVTKERSRLVLPGAAPEADEAAADTSAEVKQIVGEVAATSTRFKVTHLDAADDAAPELAVARTPAIVFGGGISKGKLHYYGLPAGYEMSTLVATLMDIGSGEPTVPAEVADALGKLDKDVHVQVFVTPG
ncbi:MAG: dehydrogenase, selenocysteine-containing protein [Myxococcales bacterium]|nr:dehydrogenase, selenocysteine-containing protein [Myxococcales bacterium]